MVMRIQAADVTDRKGSEEDIIDRVGNGLDISICSAF